jgi:hypothetical protein
MCVNNESLDPAQVLKMTNASFYNQSFCWIHCTWPTSCWNCLYGVHHVLKATPQENRVTMNEDNQRAGWHTTYPHPIQQSDKCCHNLSWHHCGNKGMNRLVDAIFHFYVADEWGEQWVTSLNFSTNCVHVFLGHSVFSGKL